VLALPARDDADEIVALMLCHLLRRRGVPAATQTVTAPFDATASVLDRHSVEVVVVSALPPSTVGAARQLCRRLRERYDTLRLVIAIWRHTGTDAELRERLRISGSNDIVRSLDHAVSAVGAALPPGVMKPVATARRALEKHGEDQPPLAAAARL
jgi:hypothetical protein